MKRFIIILYAVILVIGCNETKTSKHDNNTSTNSSIDVKEEFPPPNICNSDLGILKMDANGYSTGKRTEFTELKKLLKNNGCDIIEITYQLKGSYGDNITKKLIYNKREKRLQDISTQNNVIEDYKNVSVEGLKKFLAAGEKDFYSLTDYTNSTYDFNNREMTNRAIGSQPAQSELDGSVSIVKNYIIANAKDASSIGFLEWSKVSTSGEYWVVRCKYKGSNSMGNVVTEISGSILKTEKWLKQKIFYNWKLELI
jgi:hypothetical protein